MTVLRLQALPSFLSCSRIRAIKDILSSPCGGGIARLDDNALLSTFWVSLAGDVEDESLDNRRIWFYRHERGGGVFTGRKHHSELFPSAPRSTLSKRNIGTRAIFSTRKRRQQSSVNSSRTMFYTSPPAPTATKIPRWKTATRSTPRERRMFSTPFAPHLQSNEALLPQPNLFVHLEE